MSFVKVKEEKYDPEDIEFDDEHQRVSVSHSGSGYDEFEFEMEDVEQKYQLPAPGLCVSASQAEMVAPHFDNTKLESQCCGDDEEPEDRYTGPLVEDYDCSCCGGAGAVRCRYFPTRVDIIGGVRRNRRICFVNGCGTRYPKLNSACEGALAVFHAPTTINQQVWRTNIPYKNRPFDFTKNKLCAKHFQPEQIIKEEFIKKENGETQALPLPVYKWRLVPNATPTIFNFPQILQLKAKRELRKQKKLATLKRRYMRKRAKELNLPDPFAGTQYESRPNWPKAATDGSRDGEVSGIVRKRKKKGRGKRGGRRNKKNKIHTG